MSRGKRPSAALGLSKQQQSPGADDEAAGAPQPRRSARTTTTAAGGFPGANQEPNDLEEKDSPGKERERLQRPALGGAAAQGVGAASGTELHTTRPRRSAAATAATGVASLHSNQRPRRTAIAASPAEGLEPRPKRARTTVQAAVKHDDAPAAMSSPCSEGSDPSGSNSEDALNSDTSGSSTSASDDRSSMSSDVEVRPSGRRRGRGRDLTARGRRGRGAASKSRALESSDSDEEDDDDGLGQPELGQSPESLAASVNIRSVADQPAVTVSGAAFADIVAAYNVLRSFSWQLKLSPFSLQDLAAAMGAGLPCSLLDEVHVCVLRTLACYEPPEQRSRRALDLSHLDQVTWPEFVWEWLELVEDEELLQLRVQPISNLRMEAPKPAAAQQQEPPQQQQQQQQEPQPQQPQPQQPQQAEPAKPRSAAAALAAFKSRASAGSGLGSSTVRQPGIFWGSSMPPREPNTRPAAIKSGPAAPAPGNSRTAPPGHALGVVHGAGPACLRKGSADAAGSCAANGPLNRGERGNNRGFNMGHSLSRALRIKRRGAGPLPAGGGVAGSSGPPPGDMAASEGVERASGGAEGVPVGSDQAAHASLAGAAAAATDLPSDWGLCQQEGSPQVAPAGDDVGGSSGAHEQATSPIGRAIDTPAATSGVRTRLPTSLLHKPTPGAKASQQLPQPGTATAGKAAAGDDASRSLRPRKSVSFAAILKRTPRASTGQAAALPAVNAAASGADQQGQAGPSARLPSSSSGVADGGAQPSVGASLQAPALQHTQLLGTEHPNTQPLQGQLGVLNRHSGAACVVQRLGKALRDKRPSAAEARAEFYSMSTEQNAAILARLCDDLLELAPIRAEIDRRESLGLMHAGRGGRGGAWPQFTPEEQAARKKQLQDGAGDDGNTDVCVLCGVGGSLLCCDGCPAAYHLRCISETSKSIPEGDWLCPECSVGGRGEAAGLRIPMAGCSKATGYPAWVAYGCVFSGHCSRQAPPAAPAPHGRRSKEPCQRAASVSDMQFVGMALLTGTEAQDEVKQLRRLRCGADDRPQETSLTDLQAGPYSGCSLQAGNTDLYVNRYRSAWAVSMTALKGVIEAGAKKVVAKKAGPATTPGLAPALPLPRFQWPQSLGKGNRAMVRCGKCLHCLRPSMKKACLAPLVRDNEGGTAELQPHGRLTSVQYYLLKAERDLWGLLDGLWALPAGKGLEHRRLWVRAVREAETAAALAPRLLELEMAIRRSLPILEATWDPQQRDLQQREHVEALLQQRRQDALLAAQRRRQATKLAASSTKKGPGRPPSKKKSLGAGLMAFMAERKQAAAAQAGAVVTSGLNTAACSEEAEEQETAAAEVEAAEEAPQGLDDEQPSAGPAMQAGSKVLEDPMVTEAQPLANGTCAHSGSSPTLEPVVEATGSPAPRVDEPQPAEDKGAAAKDAPCTAAGGQEEERGADTVPTAADAQRQDASPNVPSSAKLPSPSGEDQQAEEVVGVGRASLRSARQAALMGAPNATATPPAVVSATPMVSQRGGSQEPQAGISAPEAGPADHEASPQPGLQLDSWWQEVLDAAAELDMLDEVQPDNALAMRQARASWWWWRSRSSRSEAFLTLPRHDARRLARRGGKVELPKDCVIYHNNLLHTTSRRLAWVAATEAATSTAQLAVQVRELDQAIQWDRIKRPADTPSAAADSAAPVPEALPSSGTPAHAALPQVAGSLIAKRVATDSGETQYLLAPPAQEKALTKQEQQEAAQSEAPSVATWMAEANLPLWLIKAYEEKARTEEARRAAAQPDRPAAPQHAPHTTRQAALGLQEAVCQGCGMLLAESTMGGGTSCIRCCTCCAAFHGACVGLTQWAVAGLGKKWDCRKCAASKAAQRQAALDKYKERRAARGMSAPFVLSEQELMRQAMEDVAASLRGRPGVEDGGEGQGGTAPARRRSGQMRSPPQAGGPELYCICQQPWDPLQEMVGCDSCDGWFHPACVNASLSDVVAQEVWYCPTCVSSGKRTHKRKAAEANGLHEEAAGAGMGRGRGRGMWRGRGLGRGAGRGQGRAPAVEHSGAAPRPPGLLLGRGRGRGRILGRHPQGRGLLHKDIGSSKEVGAGAAGAPPVTSRTLAHKITLRAMAGGAVAGGRGTGAAPGGGRGGRAAPGGGRLGRGRGRGRGLGALHASAPGGGAASPAAAPSWHAAAINVVKRLMQEPFSAPFNTPVNLGEAVGYLSVVKQPMDLSTILQRLRTADAYDAASAVAADMRLIAANCRAYNEPGSDIVRQAEQMLAAFNMAWKLAGLPLKRRRSMAATGEAKEHCEDGASDSETPTKAGGRSHPAPKHAPPTAAAASGPLLPVTTPGQPAAAKAQKGYAAPSGHAGNAPGAEAGAPGHAGTAAPGWAASAAKVLRRIIAQPVAAPFKQPVDVQEVPDYTQIIKRPMDLGTILRSLQAKQLCDSAAVLRDVALVWANCKRYNQPKSHIVAQAEECRQLFVKLWTEAGLPLSSHAGHAPGPGRGPQQQHPTPAPAVPTHEVKSPRSEAVRASAPQGLAGTAAKPASVSPGAPAPTAAPNWQAKATAALRQVLQAEVCQVFSEPVNVQEVPDYYAIIAQPMDLGTVMGKLRRRKYQALEQFVSDVELIWRNCFTYNRKGSAVYKMGQQAKTLWGQAVEAAGLQVTQGAQPCMGSPPAAGAQAGPAKAAAATQSGAAAARGAGPREAAAVPLPTSNVSSQRRAGPATVPAAGPQATEAGAGAGQQMRRRLTVMLPAAAPQNGKAAEPPAGRAAPSVAVQPGGQGQVSGPSRPGKPSNAGGRGPAVGITAAGTKRVAASESPPDPAQQGNVAKRARRSANGPGQARSARARDDVGDSGAAAAPPSPLNRTTRRTKPAPQPGTPASPRVPRALLQLL